MIYVEIVSYRGNKFLNHQNLKIKCHSLIPAFSSKTGIRNHILRVHSDKMPVEKCKICSKIFKQKDMWSHVITHNQDHKHKCSFVLPDGTICPSKYRSAGQLQKHVNVIHRNIRFFKCNRCVKEYKSRTLLEEHILADHVKLRLNCVVKGCRTKFRYLRAMCGHIKVVHRELSQEEKEAYLKEAKKIPLPKVEN